MNPLGARVLLLLATCLGAACGEVTDGTYRGEPIFTLKGRLTLAPGFEPQRAVRVAIVWFPVYGTGDVPFAGGASELELRGAFPLPFEFPLYAPPPEEALLGTAGSGRTRHGQLVVYDDLDGDGHLTIAAPGASVTDRVLALSGGAPGVNSTYLRDWLIVTYLEPPGDDAAMRLGLPPGYSVVRTVFPTNEDVLVAESVIDLQLHDDPRLSTAICSDAYLQFPLEDPCGLLKPLVEVTGSIRATSAGGADVTVWVERPTGTPTIDTIDGAKVTLNASIVPQKNRGGAYVLTELTRSSVRLGPNFLRVDAPGLPPYEVTIMVPEDPVLQAPVDATAGHTYSVYWTPSKLATTYYVVAGTNSAVTAPPPPFIGTAPLTPGPLLFELGAQRYLIDGFTTELRVKAVIEVVP